MLCPAVGIVVAASPGGIYTLVRHDRGFRWLHILILCLYVAAWWAYYSLLERPGGLRIMLEVLFGVLLILGFLRVRWLMKNRGIIPPLGHKLQALYVWAAPLVSSRWLLGIKIVFICMLVVRWTGLLSIDSAWFAAVAALLALLIGVRAIRLNRERRRQAETSVPSLAQMLANNSGASTQPTQTKTTACPLGYGGGAK